jgi:hypothetical protein
VPDPLAARGSRHPGGWGAPAAATRPRARRSLVRLATAAGLTLWLIGPTAARSDSGPDFGTLGLNTSTYGSVVSLVTPAAGLAQADDEFVVQRDVLQSDNTDPGLIQAGVYRSGSGIALDNCGAHAAYVVFTEVKAANSMAYRCQLYNDVSPGALVTLDVFRFKTAGTWGIRLDGVQTGSIYRLGFAKAAPAIGTEIQSLGNSYQSQTSTRYEPAGAAQWTVYTTTGRQHSRRVTRADSISAYPMADHLWKTTRPPAEVTIKHRVP